MGASEAVRVESPRYVIVDDKGKRVEPNQEFDDPCLAMGAARQLGTKNTVLRVDGTTPIAISHQGPGGWSPRARKVAT